MAFIGIIGARKFKDRKSVEALVASLRKDSIIMNALSTKYGSNFPGHSRKKEISQQPGRISSLRLLHPKKEVAFADKKNRKRLTWTSEIKNLLCMTGPCHDLYGNSTDVSTSSILPFSAANLVPRWYSPSKKPGGQHSFRSDRAIN